MLLLSWTSMPTLSRKGQAIGLRDLTTNFSQKKDSAVPDTSPAQELPLASH